MERKNLLKRIQAKTPRRNKTIGRTVGVLSAMSTTILFTIEIESDWIKTILIILSVALGGQSIYQAQKVLK